jgi:hypothetical protein
MDPLHPAVRTAIENARRSIPDGWTLDNAPNNENADLVIAYLADRLVPPPSADARAKLEQVATKRTGCSEPTSRCNERWPGLPNMWCSGCLIEGLLALPPHEGETPQPAAESGWRSIESAPKDGTNVLLSDGVKVSQGGWLSEVDQGADYEGQGVIATGWWTVDGDMTPTLWQSLPPVVQTRPEEPR